MADSDITHLGDPTTKDKIKLPMWAWIAGGAVVLGVGYFYYRSRQSAAAAAANTATTVPTSGYVDPTTILPMFQGTQPATPTASSGNGDVYNASGQDTGQYLYGGAQLNYLNQNIGSFGLTTDEVNDVQTAYNQVAGLQGANAANSMHYSWLAPGNVQAIPMNLLSASDIIQGLP